MRNSFLQKIKTKFLCCTGYLNSIKSYRARFIANSSSCTTTDDILDKLKARDFNATSLSTYDFSTLYITLSHNLIKDKLIDLIERTFQREGSPYLACNDRNAFFLWKKTLKNIMHGHVKMYVMR